MSKAPIGEVISIHEVKIGDTVRFDRRAGSELWYDSLTWKVTRETRGSILDVFDNHGNLTLLDRPFDISVIGTTPTLGRLSFRNKHNDPVQATTHFRIGAPAGVARDYVVAELGSLAIPPERVDNWEPLVGFPAAMVGGPGGGTVGLARWARQDEVVR